MEDVLNKQRPKTPKTLSDWQINEKIFDIEIKSPAEIKEKNNNTLLEKGKLILSALQSFSVNGNKENPFGSDRDHALVETFNETDEKNLKIMFFETLEKIQ